MGSGASGGASSGSGGGATGGTGGAPLSACDQPIAAGPCEAAFPRYGYDNAVGYCIPFIYGGCEGNDNNFESLEECDAACRNGEPTPTDHCASVLDCGLGYFGCCGICEPMDLEAYEPVNVGFIADRERQSREACAEVLCGACEQGTPVSQNYGVACEKERCVAYDIRERASLTGCTDDSDCRLRNGTSCCEACDSSLNGWIAVSAEPLTLADALCGGMEVGCPPCAPIPPQQLRTECVEGTCRVIGE